MSCVSDSGAGSAKPISRALACRTGDRGGAARDLRRPRHVGTQGHALEAPPAPQLCLVRTGRLACVLLRCAVADDLAFTLLLSASSSRSSRDIWLWRRRIARTAASLHERQPEDFPG